MSVISERSSFGIAPPIILDENGDVQLYPSVGAVIRHLEAVDVLNNEYTFHDSTGRVLEAKVHKGKVSLVPTPTLEPESKSLRTNIVGVLRFHGMPEEGLSSLSFGELVQLLAEKSKR
jgi:hypothetical protein